jgi:hypothetical protein
MQVDDETEHPAKEEAAAEVVGADAAEGLINVETEAVNFCFIQCCRATLTQAKALNEEGSDTMELLLIYKPAGIPALIIAAMNAATGNGKGADPKKIKAVLAKKLKGLFFWCCQRKCEELPLDLVIRVRASNRGNMAGTP